MKKPILILAALTLAACVEEEPIDGRSAFLDNCAACHGVDARGDGPMARGLATAVPDLTTISARNGGTFPRDAVMSKIDGYQADGFHDSVMPEFGAGDMGHTVIVENNGLGTPVPLKLLVLTEYLESLQR
jgi:mono/diheme cytochrome c family protein